MKHLIKLLTATTLLALLMGSCETEEFFDESLLTGTWQSGVFVLPVF